MLDSSHPLSSQSTAPPLAPSVTDDAPLLTPAITPTHAHSHSHSRPLTPIISDVHAHAHAHAHGTPKHSSSNAATLQNLIKPFIGAGILALPKAFAQGGVLASALLVLLLALICQSCIVALIACSDEMERKYQQQYRKKIKSVIDVKNEDEPRLDPIDLARSQQDTHYVHPHIAHIPVTSDGDTHVDVDGTLTEWIPPSFADIGQYAYGSWGRAVVNVNLILSQLGFCIAYVCFISANMHDVIPSISRESFILILFPSLSLLVQLRHISSLAWASVLGNIVYVVAIIVIFYDGFSHRCCISNSEVNYVRVMGLPFVFGTASFALEGIGLILPVKRAMRTPSSFSLLLNTCLMIVTSMYISFGIFAYLFYGDNTLSNITGNLDSGAVSHAVRVALSISLFFSYAIQAFPVFAMCDGLIVSLFRSHSSHPSRSRSRSPSSYSSVTDGDDTIPIEHTYFYTKSRKATFTTTIIRIVIVGCTCSIGAAFSNFGLVVSLVGSFSNSAIAYILPQLFYLRICQSHVHHHATPTSASTSARPYSDSDVDADIKPSWLTRCFPATWTSPAARQRWRCVYPWCVVVCGCTASVVGVVMTVQEMVSGSDETSS